MTDTTAALDDLDFMTSLLDIVIPPSASGKLPGAGALGLGAEITAALQADPMLGPLVESGAQAVCEAALAQHAEGLQGMTAEDGAKLVEEQLAAHPFFIIHPKVLAGIGEPPRPPFPEGFEVEATDAKLLESMQARRKT
jgi:hypothetical protein